MKKILGVDMFCGAGGTSTGLLEAGEMLGKPIDLTAINHWDIAVSSHEQNHPGVRHFCEPIDAIIPRQIFPESKIDILWASPECIDHSIAKRGKLSDQSRATAWCVTRWAEALLPDHILVENVPRFAKWGPLNSKFRPIKRREGETFQSWLQTLRGLGYKVDHKVFCAADYGDPTSRKRLFVQAVRGNRKIVWPEPTHSAETEQMTFGKLDRWRTAEDIIDWDVELPSIFNRKKPLAPNTINRIFEGLGFGIESPFLIAMEHGGRVVPVNRPLPTVTTAKGGAFAIVKPYLIELRGTSPTQIANSAKPINQPIPTITAGGGHYAVCLPRLSEIEDAIRVNAQPILNISGKSYLLDIGFRMLSTRELALAQGFREGYILTGKIKDQTRQIGNAVPRRLARALALATLSQQSDISQFLQKPETIHAA